MKYIKTCKTKQFKEINREYIVTSAEIKKSLEVEGEIISIGLHSGRSPNDIEKGVSPDLDRWYITTKEIKFIKDKEIQ